MIIDFSWLRRSLRRPRRFPEPCEDAYRAGWSWGVICGLCPGLLGVMIVVLWRVGS